MNPAFRAVLAGKTQLKGHHHEDRSCRHSRMEAWPAASRAERSTTGTCSRRSPARRVIFSSTSDNLEGDFSSPRHRHNFDQFRFQIEGTMNFDRNGKMTAGRLGLFP